MIKETLEVLTGTIDGSNQVFETSTDYEPGTFNLVLRGLFDGVMNELGGKKVKITPAPKTGDIVMGFYRIL